MIPVEDEILASRTTVADRLGETAGQSHPLGATLVPGGANFSIFSRSALGIDLLFFDRHDDPRPSRVIPIDQSANRTYHYGHVFVPEIQAGQICCRVKRRRYTQCGEERSGRPTNRNVVIL
jgi:pullulanase/glycogen debranching enzyme